MDPCDSGRFIRSYVMNLMTAGCKRIQLIDYLIDHSPSSVCSDKGKPFYSPSSAWEKSCFLNFLMNARKKRKRELKENTENDEIPFFL